MTYNREKYLKRKFDQSNVEEVKIYQKIIQDNLSGIKYNMFIKDYLIEKIRTDLLSINFFEYPILGELIYKLIPLLYLGMFNTTKKILLSTPIEDKTIKAFKEEWIEMLEEADDLPELFTTQK